MKLPATAKMAIELIEASSHQAYLVGGAVRDMVMGKCPNDIDITTNMLPDEIEELFCQYQTLDIGKKHGTITVFIDKNPIEITTYRVESGYTDNRHPEKISFTASLEEDLARRDFTINALCYHEKTGLIDLFSGMEDIENRKIRAIGLPVTRFQEDGLRILRGFRFMAQLGFSMEETTKSAIFVCKSLLQNISRERITIELTKLLVADNPLPALCLMNELGVLPDLVKPLTQTDCNAITASSKSLLLRLALALTPEAIEALCFDIKTKSAAKLLLSYHQKKIEQNKMANLSNLSKPFIKKLLRQIGLDHFLLLLEYQSLFWEDVSFQRGMELANEIVENGECYAIKQLALKGDDLICLGIPQGKRVGEGLESLLEGVINNRVANQREALLAYLKQLKC